MSTEPPLLIAPRPKNWFDRNWKWFVPVVCLGGLVFFGALGGGIFFLVERTLKNSEPYHVALDRIHSSPDVASALGTPLQDPWFVMGNYRIQNNDRYEDLTFEVTGPKAVGRVQVIANSTGGEWSYRALSLYVESSRRLIDLKPKHAD